MKNREFMQMARTAMSDKTPIAVEIEIQQAWLLVTLIQLATRHPGIGTGLRANAEHIARQFQQVIADHYPEANAALELGWNPANDV